jgi:hypothetical protein
MHSYLSMKPPSSAPTLILSAAPKASTAATQTPKGKTKTENKHNQENTSHSILIWPAGFPVHRYLNSPHLPYLRLSKELQDRLRSFVLPKQSRNRPPSLPLPPQRLPHRTPELPNLLRRSVLPTTGGCFCCREDKEESHVGRDEG